MISQRAPTLTTSTTATTSSIWAGIRNRDNLTLDERDFDDLLASDALFARKFDERKSSKLLDLLDIYVHYCDFLQPAWEGESAQSARVQ